MQRRARRRRRRDVEEEEEEVEESETRRASGATFYIALYCNPLAYLFIHYSEHMLGKFLLRFFCSPARVAKRYLL